AEDDDARRRPQRWRLVGLAPGRVVVRRLRCHLARARVDAPVDGFAGELLLPLVLDALELALEPRVQVLRAPLERRFKASLGLHERLAEGAADAHRLPH